MNVNIEQADIYRERGRTCERKGNLAGAKMNYDLALKENLFDYNAMANLAWVEHKDNNSEIAKKLIEKVCKAKPNKERFKDLRYRIENGISTLK